MYCTKCGNLCGEMDNVCTRCGEKLRDNFYGDYNKTVPNYSSGYSYNSNSNYYTNPYAYAQPYAGFWIRFGASIIDGIISVVGILILYGIVGVIIGFGTMNTGGNWLEILTGITGNLIGIIGGWLYFAFFESSIYQATPGKMAVGIRVVDLAGNRLSFGRATGRHFAKWISQLTLYIGYIMAGFTEKKQGLHDMIAGTLVVNK